MTASANEAGELKGTVTLTGALPGTGAVKLSLLWIERSTDQNSRPLNHPAPGGAIALAPTFDRSRRDAQSFCIRSATTVPQVELNGVFDRGRYGES